MPQNKPDHEAARKWATLWQNQLQDPKAIVARAYLNLESKLTAALKRGDDAVKLLELAVTPGLSVLEQLELEVDIRAFIAAQPKEGSDGTKR